MAGTISSQDDNFILHDKELPFKLAFWRYMHITQTVSLQGPSKICTNIFCKGNTQHRYHMPITKLKEKQFLVYIFLKNKKGGFFAQAVSTLSIYFKLPKVHNIGTGPVVQSSSNIC